MSDATFNFYKLNGANNTFLAADLRSESNKAKLHSVFSDLLHSELAKKLCHPYTGLSCDGLFLIDTSDKADFKWHFYNADGSSAEMCGNAARCAALFFHQILGGEKLVKFETIAGIIEAEVLSKDNVCVSMTVPSDLEFNQAIEIDGQILSFDFINSGVPHFIIEVSELDFDKEKNELQWDHTQKQVKTHERFQPNSTNVTLVKAVSENEILSLTYERGVNGFTQACGTGAVAAAISHSHKTGQKLIKIHVPGGELNVDLHDIKPKLIGPAQIIAKVEFEN